MTLLLMVLCLVSGAPSARAESKRLLLLHHPAWRKEEAALLEALRIYTRDLNAAIVSADARSDVSPSLGQQSLAAIAEQGQRASALAVAWFFDDGGLRLYTLRVATQDLQVTPVQPRDDLDVAAQTLALKLRAFLTQDTEPAQRARSNAADPGDPEPASRRPPAATPEPAQRREESSAASPVQSEASTTSQTESAKTAPPLVVIQQNTTVPQTPIKGSRPVHLEVGFGYGVDVPIDPQWLRHQLVLRTALVLPSRWLAIELDGAAATRPTIDVAPYQVSVSDIPIGLALSLRLLRPRFLLSVGPRASLHIIQASLLGNGSSGGDIYRFSAGIGAVAHGRLRLYRFLSLQLSLIAEGVVPRQRFAVAGTIAADLGAFRFGSSLGLLFEVL